MGNDIIASVCCITYNHVEYVKEALDGFLMQKANFPIEIIIHDDCSTDGTADIVREYKEKYPELITAILQTENQKSKGKKIFPITFERARGKYIALCEGDDYWTDPHKLQKQVDFLEDHPDHSICFTRAKVFFEDDGYPPFEVPKLDNQIHTLTLEDLLRSNLIVNCTVMFRRGLIKNFPSWYFTVLFGDWSLHILNAQHGKVGYFPEVMAAYRVHAGGIWSMRKLKDKLLEEVKFYKVVDKHLNFEYHHLIREMLAHKYQMIAHEYWRDKDFVQARHYSIRSFYSLSIKQLITNKSFIKKSLSILKHSLRRTFSYTAKSTFSYFGRSPNKQVINQITTRE